LNKLQYIDKIPTSVELPNTAFYLERILLLFMFLTQIQIIRSELVVALISLPIGFLVVAKEVLEYNSCLFFDSELSISYMIEIVKYFNQYYDFGWDMGEIDNSIE